MLLPQMEYEPREARDHRPRPLPRSACRTRLRRRCQNHRRIRGSRYLFELTDMVAGGKFDLDR